MSCTGHDHTSEATTVPSRYGRRWSNLEREPLIPQHSADPSAGSSSERSRAVVSRELVRVPTARGTIRSCSSTRAWRLLVSVSGHVRQSAVGTISGPLQSDTDPAPAWFPRHAAHRRRPRSPIGSVGILHALYRLRRALRPMQRAAGRGTGTHRGRAGRPTCSRSSARAHRAGGPLVGRADRTVLCLELGRGRSRASPRHLGHGHRRLPDLASSAGRRVLRWRRQRPRSRLHPPLARREHAIPSAGRTRIDGTADCVAMCEAPRRRDRTDDRPDPTW
jgi:hypothetical protein